MKRLITRFLISLVLGGAMLYLAVRQLEFDQIGTALREASWVSLLPYFACMAVQHFFRAWRWGQLLAPIQPQPFSRILPISTVGFFAILALPLRMGEFVRPYLIADPPKLTMSQGLGTMAVERVFDGLILSLVAFVAVAIAKWYGQTVPSWIFGAGLIAMGLFFAGLVVLVMTLWQRDRAITLCHKIFSLISTKVADKAAGIARGIVDGFKVLPDLKRLSLFVTGTCLYWFFNAVAFWALAGGFGISLHIGSATALMALIGIGIMIPGAPGFIGSYELFAKGALELYVPAATLKARGTAFILVSHAANALWYVGTGVIGLLSPQISFRRVWAATADGELEQAAADPATGGEPSS